MTQTLKQYADEAEYFGLSSDLNDRLDWIVLLCRSRDASLLDESNFASAVESLGGESETLEIVRFGHWAVGWIEHILLHPSRLSEAEEIECALEDYPVLDDSDFSEREQESVMPAWNSYGQRQWAHMLCEATGIALTSPVYYLLCEADSDDTLTWHEARGEQSGIEHTNEGPRFNFRYADKRYHYFSDYITRDEVAALVKMLRSKAREAKESASLVT
jgi:hypothetical protein